MELAKLINIIKLKASAEEFLRKKGILKTFTHFKWRGRTDESCFGGQRKGNKGRGAKDKIPIFGILERNSKVKS